MPRVHRKFGPSSRVTAVVALASLASVPFWSGVGERWQAWTLAGRLRDATARGEAADGLVQLGPAATPWVIGAMSDPDAKVRLVACSILPRTDPDHPARSLDALAAALKDGDPSVRKSAADQLWLASGTLAARAGPASRDRVVGALRAALGDGAKDVRIAAAIALGANGESARPAIADLDRALAGPDPATGVFAAQALLRIDRAGSRPRVIPVLHAFLSDPSLGLGGRQRVVQTLIQEEGEGVAAASLIALLGHDDRNLRGEAILLLTEHCPTAEATLPALVTALRSDDGWLRCEAAFFLLKRRDPGLIARGLATLEGALVDPTEGSIPPGDLIRKLRFQSPEFVERLASALNGPAGREEAPRQRLNAIVALGEIGPPEAEVAILALREAASSGDRAVALPAARVLAKVAPAMTGALVPSLIDWSRPGEDVAARLVAMETLGEIGPAAAAAVPALLRAADEEEVRVSSAAIGALSRIDPARADLLKRSIRNGN